MTADAHYAIEELQRICFENNAARRDADLFASFEPQVISVELISNQRTIDAASEDDYSFAAAAASIGTQDRATTRRMLSKLITAPAAAFAAKRSAEMRREGAAFITHSDVATPKFHSLLSMAPRTTDSSHSRLQITLASHILAFCASFSSPSATSYSLNAAVARMHLRHSAPMILCLPRSVLRAVLVTAVDLCSLQITEKCGLGPETYELANAGDLGAQTGGKESTFPVRLLLCCKNEEAMKSVTGVVGLFLEDWLSSAVKGNRRFVSVYVDAAAMGTTVACTDVLQCILGQVIDNCICDSLRTFFLRNTLFIHAFCSCTRPCSCGRRGSAEALLTGRKWLHLMLHRRKLFAAA